MARDGFAIEKLLRIFKENSDTESFELIFGDNAPVGTSGETADAPIGSLYSDRVNGRLYIKQADNDLAADWAEFGTGDVALDELKWRNEKVRFATDDTLSAGNVDISALTDNDDMVIGDISVGEYVIGDRDGTPALFEVTALPGGNDITIAAAGQAIADNDTFMVQQYLPDGAGQEGQAIIHFPLASGAGVKVGDIDWNFATGINISGSYSPASGDVSSSDSVESAIEKLDGNNDAQDSVLGTAQGDTDLGTFTGTTISDNTSVKGALQELETSVESKADQSVVDEIDQNVDDLITLSGVAENSTDLGTFTGDIISDNTTVKGALQELETELVDTRDNTDDLITLSGMPENSTDFGTFTGDLLADGQDSKQLFQRIEDLLDQMKGVQVTGITTSTAVDAVPHADVKACKWLVEAFEEATPANRKALEVYALTDGTDVDDTVYAKLKIGSNFNLDIAVAINGANMEIQAASTTAGVTVTARRIEVVQNTL